MYPIRWIKNRDDNSIPALVTGRDLFWDSSKSEDNNLSDDSMPSLKEHLGSNSLCDNCKILGNNTSGVLGESLDKTELNLIVKLDDVWSGVSMTGRFSSKSYKQIICASVLLIWTKSCMVYTWKIGIFFRLLGLFQNWRGFWGTSKQNYTGLREFGWLFGCFSSIRDLLPKTCQRNWVQIKIWFRWYIF